MLSTILLVLEKKRGEALPLCPFHEVGLGRITDPSEIRSRQVPERDADANLATLGHRVIYKGQNVPIRVISWHMASRVPAAPIGAPAFLSSQLL